MAAKTISLRTRRNSRLHGRSRAGNLLNFLFLALIGVFMALPMVYAVSSAFKPLDELFLFPPRFLVRRPTLDNFSDLFRLMSTLALGLSFRISAEIRSRSSAEKAYRVVLPRTSLYSGGMAA